MSEVGYHFSVHPRAADNYERLIAYYISRGKTREQITNSFAKISDHHARGLWPQPSDHLRDENSLPVYKINIHGCQTHVAVDRRNRHLEIIDLEELPSDIFTP